MRRILIGSLLGNEQSEEPVRRPWKLIRTRPGNDEWKSHLFLEEPLGSMLTANVHVSVFCTSPGALDASSASALCDTKAEPVMKSKIKLKEQKRTLQVGRLA